MAKYVIVMVRHGESEWNQKNLFCGWYDAQLSEKGKQEHLLVVQYPVGFIRDDWGKIRTEKTDKNMKR